LQRQKGRGGVGAASPGHRLALPTTSTAALGQKLLSKGEKTNLKTQNEIYLLDWLQMRPTGKCTYLLTNNKIIISFNLCQKLAKPKYHLSVLVVVV